MPPAAYRGGENSVSVSWPGASKPRRAAGGWFSSECDKIGSSPRCSRGWHEHRRSTYNNGSHAGRASTCAMNPQAISRARRRLCGGRAKSLTLSRRPGAATLPVVTEVSPSQVYGARLLSGFGAQPHREFKSRHLRQHKRKRRPGARRPGGVPVPAGPVVSVVVSVGILGTPPGVPEEAPHLSRHVVDAALAGGGEDPGL